MDRGTAPRVYLAPGSRWYRVDLRAWGGQRMAMRDPEASGWPSRGQRTDVREVAEEWAWVYLHWIRGELRRQRLGIAPEIALTDAVREHLEHRAAVVERATLSCDRTAMNHLLAAFYASTRVGEITTAEMQQLVDSMLRRGYRPSTLDTYRRSWRVMFKRVAGVDPTQELFLGLQARDPLGDVMTFEPEQLAQLFKAAAVVDEQRIGEFPSGVLACGLGLFMGLRQGEIFALQWADIDAVTKTVRVRFQVPKDTVELRPTKGKWARTALVLPGWWEHHRPDRVGFICGRLGRPVGSRTQRNLITRILDTARLNRKGLGWHVLRHTFARTFLEAEGSLEQLQKSLGHSSIGTTEHRYGHLRGDTAAAQARRRIYGQE